ncbi:NDP-hexose 2,3-dehydratase family protein [Tropicimonas sediminicola]|uniref:Oxidase EvaA n=1 Tax=Tropicimonas sediminicola TaxID=1031541 RepID=A0A239ME51_9RHOB|nr:NDP-hexose 2,3-dehydratase family protein [Tropicimonas sediminicola]SNT41317.1 oxidase EvaA [Tropicimonas sediminicola]
MTGEADAIRIWLREARANSHLQLDRVALADCAQWLYRDGGLHHATGRFFSIVGLEVKDVGEARHGRQLAMIDQPEVGWLGFIIRRTPHGIEWLLQAKTEPGNIDATQLAPSIQATRSNYNRAHGGRPTEFLDLFRGAKAFVSDGPHSEQGTRFLWKFNRNSVLILPDGEAPDASGLEHWKWCPSGSIRDLLADDYCVNTDARSVTATAPWALLADGGALFSAPALAASYEQVVEPKELESFLDRINALPHGRVPRWQHIALDEMAGFSWGDSGLLDDKNDEQVACFEIRVRGREVDHWYQPFLMQKGQTDHVLLMRLTEKGAEFFVRLFHEVGFGTRVEYGPSLHSAFELAPI